MADLLKRIEIEPRNADGKPVTPIAWECGCAEGNCGACAMLINGKPLLACKANLDDFPPAPVILEPLSKFPVVRDLWVDRSYMFEALRRAEVWIEAAYDESAAPVEAIPPESARRAQEYGRCIHCGICLEACPSFTSASRYIGPAAIAFSAAYQELAPTSADSRRMQRCLMQPGGIAECGFAMNCVKLCPREIPLTNAIAVTNRRVNAAAWDMLRGK